RGLTHRTSEIYDLRRDPGELENLADRDDFPAPRYAARSTSFRRAHARSPRLGTAVAKVLTSTGILNPTAVHCRRGIMNQSSRCRRGILMAAASVLSLLGC